MAFFSLSPSVDITESDFTIGIDNVSTSIGGYAGSFEWGPVGYIVNLASTKDLEEKFGLPNDDNAQDWFCAYNFLTYSNYLKCVRVVDSDACNAVAVDDEYNMCSDNGFVGDASFHDDFDINLTEYNSSGIRIKNVDDFEIQRNSVDTVRQAKIIAKYPGHKGNSLKVSICDGGEAFDIWEYRSYFSGTARKITVDKIYSDGLVYDSDENLKVEVTPYLKKKDDNSTISKANTSFVVDEKSNLKGNFTYGSPYIRDITDMSNIRVDMDVYLPYTANIGTEKEYTFSQKVGKIRSIVNNNTVRLTKALGSDNNIIKELYGNSLPSDKTMIMQGYTYVYGPDGEKIPVYHKRKREFSDANATLADKGEYFVKWAEDGSDPYVKPYILVTPFDIYERKPLTGEKIGEVIIPKGTLFTPGVGNKTDKNGKLISVGIDTDNPYELFTGIDVNGRKYKLVNWAGCAKEYNEEFNKSQPFTEEYYYSMMDSTNNVLNDYIPLVRYEQKYVYGTPEFGVDKSEIFIPSDVSFKLSDSKAVNCYFQIVDTDAFKGGYGVIIRDKDTKSEITDEKTISERFGGEITPEALVNAKDAETDSYDPAVVLPVGFSFENLYNGDILTVNVLRSDSANGSKIDDVFDSFTQADINHYNEDQKQYEDGVFEPSDVNIYTTAFDDDNNNIFLTYYSSELFETTIPINFGVELTKKITRVSGRPSTSAFAAKNGAEMDEVCVVVIDEDGKFTGQIGTVLERFTNLSKCSDGKNVDGANNYWVTVINNESKYIWIPDDFCSSSGSYCSKTLTNWGVPAFERGNSENTVFDTMKHQPITVSLDGGFSNPDNISSGDRMDGFECFSDPQAVDVNLLIGGVLTEAIADYLVDDIVEKRRDCVCFLSPPLSTNLNIDPLTKVLQFRNLVNDSTYAIWDSGWKYQYDSYNDTYRYVPLCADIAGLCAKVDAEKGCHWSPAGYNRGLIKNVSSLVWNVENKNDRDELYEMGINSVMTVVGTGTLLFGDRTGTTKKTAFREIGIRRWFMKIEKAIANYSKYVLFEFNDAFTRASFINTVNPYLRAEQGKRACQDYLIQCDAQVNTPEVIDAQGFVANFLIKPMHSINFITLNFAAVATGTSFEEIELS